MQMQLGLLWGVSNLFKIAWIYHAGGVALSDFGIITLELPIVFDRWPTIQITPYLGTKHFADTDACDMRSFGLVCLASSTVSSLVCSSYGPKHIFICGN